MRPGGRRTTTGSATCLPRPADTSPADSGPVTPVSRPDTAAAARVFDAATTRRRSVVFEEDDELDVPDFLKSTGRTW